MRKTRLVILPTKCLHSMGFLLLFLSCPVIGDWGRIRPESENSHNAIQIEREGTCGLERDPPGRLLSYTNENGSKQCRLSDDIDLMTRKSEGYTSTRFDESQTNVRRTAQRRNLGIQENVRRTSRRNVRDVSERRDVRSRSLEPRRSTVRNDGHRSLSLSRLESERAVGRRQSTPGRNIRQYNERQRESERLHLTRRMNERQTERRLDQRRLDRNLPNERQTERRLDQQRRERNLSNERRENERAVRDRIVRNTGFTRTAETERRDFRQKRSVSVQPNIENDISRRQVREIVRERSDNRLSLARNQIDARKLDRVDSRRNIDRMTPERRLPEIRKTRIGESLERNEHTVRLNRNFDNRQKTDNRWFVTVSTKENERNTFERRMNERLEGTKSRRSKTIRQASFENIPDTAIEKMQDKSYGGIEKWLHLSSYESYKIGDWTTNCVIGAVVYFLTTRQVKTV